MIPAGSESIKKDARKKFRASFVLRKLLTSQR